MQACSILLGNVGTIDEPFFLGVKNLLNRLAACKYKICKKKKKEIILKIEHFKAEAWSLIWSLGFNVDSVASPASRARFHLNSSQSAVEQ